MSTQNSSIQKQWDIGQSVVIWGKATIALIEAGSQDDIQPQAILAMERLGAGLLVHEDRINEGVDALKGGESRKLSRLMLTIGLNNGGAARVMKDSVSCVASFMLAVACKTCFTDQETGSLLYDMMSFRGVLKKVPVSRGQVEQAVGAISGYGYKIVPTAFFNQLASMVQARLAHPCEIPGLFNRSTSRELAEILSCIFEALQDKKVKKITLEGQQTGIWLVSLLIWLLHDDIEIILHGNSLFGTPGCHFKVTLSQRDDGGWHLRKWYSEDNVSELIVGGNDKVPTVQHRSLPLSHVPINSAKDSLAVAYRLTDDAVQEVGQIAAALVDAAFECGEFRVSNAVSHSQVPFRDTCQESFISGYNKIMKSLGFNVDSEPALAVQSDIVAAYKRWMDRAKRDGIPASGEAPVANPVNEMTRLLLHIENQFFEDHGYSMIRENNLEHMGIVDPVMHVAAEALYSSIFQPFPHERPFRPLTAGNLRVNARTLWRLLCGGLAAESENELQEFRAEAIRSVLPGSVQVNKMDLAIVSNGLVAYSAPLEHLSTSKRQCSAISIMPGTLRWGEDRALFNRLQESDAADFPSSRSFYQSSERLKVFRGGTYLGIEARSNSEVVDIKTLISPSEKTLMLTTYLESASLRDAPVSVNWWRSIDAILFSEHISGHDMTAFGEECLAKSWEERRLFDTITWLHVGGNFTGSSITRCIDTTSSDEERFFEAGRLFPHRRLFVRQSAPLVQCVKAALELGEQADWAIVN